MWKYVYINSIKMNILNADQVEVFMRQKTKIHIYVTE